MSNEEKTEAKQALLGELESIKDLLSEDEWEDIPILNDTVPLPPTVSLSPTPAANTPDRPSPQLTPSTSMHIGLEDPATRAADSTGAETQDVGQALFGESDIPVLHTKYEPGAPLSSDYTTLNRKDGPTAVPDDTQGLPINLEPPSSTAPAIGTWSSLQTSDIDEAVDKLNLDLNIDSEELADHEPAEPETDRGDPPAVADTFRELTHEPRLDDPKLDAPRSGEPQPHESRPAEPAVDAALAGAPTALAGAPTPVTPGVLPGQQGLFENTEASSDNPPTDHNTPRPQRRSEFKARGENPFLPKHIRDRLHTNKALLDIIKESPLSPAIASRLSEYSPGGTKDGTQEKSDKEATPQRNDRTTASPEILATDPVNDRLNQMVDDIIAVYLPKIEAELREKLMAEFHSHPSVKG